MKSDRLPEFLRPYFWDVKFEELEASEHGFLIIKRVLDRGITVAVKWVIGTYGLDKIKEVLISSKDIDEKTGNFWAGLLGLDSAAVPCLNKPYSPIHFGLSS